jgi:hypothetical protein
LARRHFKRARCSRSWVDGLGRGSCVSLRPWAGSPPAVAHTQMMTEVLVSFRQPHQVDVTIGLDLSLMLGSPERYYQLATESSDSRQKELQDNRSDGDR